MPSLFLHRTSVVRVYLSIAATTQDPALRDPRQGIPNRKATFSPEGFTHSILSSSLSPQAFCSRPYLCYLSRASRPHSFARVAGMQGRTQANLDDRGCLQSVLVSTTYTLPYACPKESVSSPPSSPLPWACH